MMRRPPAWALVLVNLALIAIELAFIVPAFIAHCGCK